MSSASAATTSAAPATKAPVSEIMAGTATSFKDFMSSAAGTYAAYGAVGVAVLLVGRATYKMFKGRKSGGRIFAKK